MNDRRMRGKPATLTPRQILALRMWRRGKTTTQIANAFQITRSGAWQLVERAKERLMSNGVDLDDWLIADEVIHGE